MAYAPSAISVRLDERASAALDEVVKGTGLQRSEAIRYALVETAERRRRRAGLAEEARALAADEADREEMADVLAFMESLDVD